ncbi:MAG TPA: hypothetical protein VNH11_16875 [Pirellulales bacterium]|nr:hypothetical protein [Pirellulales bacterium]
MIDEAVFKNIESVELAATLTFASNLRTFLRAARSQAAFRSLVVAVETGGAGKLIERLSKLLVVEFDDGYRHPDDAAVAVYLYVLNGIHDNAPKAFASEIHDDQHGSWWWARQMARFVLDQKVPARNARLREEGLPLRLASDATSVYHSLRMPIRHLATGSHYERSLSIRLPDIKLVK